MRYMREPENRTKARIEGVPPARNVIAIEYSNSNICCAIEVTIKKIQTRLTNDNMYIISIIIERTY